MNYVSLSKSKIENIDRHCLHGLIASPHEGSISYPKSQSSSFTPAPNEPVQFDCHLLKGLCVCSANQDVDLKMLLDIFS